MEISWHSIPSVDILTNSLEPSGLMEVSSAYTFPSHIPVCATTDQLHLLGLHYLLQLSPHLPHLLHGLHMDEMVRAPLTRVVISLPLLVHMEQGQMVRLRYTKLFPG